MEISTIYGQLNPAEILLSDYLSLLELEPNPSEWGISSDFNNNPPRYYRLQRIKACLKALNIDEKSILTFETGMFLMDFSNSAIEQMELILIENFSLDFDVYVENKKASDLPRVYGRFFKLYKNISQLKNTFSGVLASSNHFLTPLFVKDQVVEKFTIQEETIEKVLVHLLNPQKIKLYERELIEQFEFPDIDLPSIDMGWY